MNRPQPGGQPFIEVTTINAHYGTVFGNANPLFASEAMDAVGDLVADAHEAPRPWRKSARRFVADVQVGSSGCFRLQYHFFRYSKLDEPGAKTGQAITCYCRPFGWVEDSKLLVS